MTLLPALLLLAAPAPSLPLVPTPALVLTQDDEKPDKREEVKELLDTFSGHCKKRGAEDLEAIGVVDALLKEFPESGPKDRKAIVSGLGKAFKEKRREDSNGVRDNKLYLAVGVALGEMGPESTAELLSWIQHKTHRKDLALQRVLILSLGKNKDEKKGKKALIDLLVHKDPPVQAATAEALGNYTHLDHKGRKEVFEEILKVLTSVSNAKDSDVNNRIARERYDVIAAPMITTLQDLSGANVREPSAWRTWWNKNKKRNWDKG